MHDCWRDIRCELFHVEKGANQLVVFVHGIPTNYRAWNSQIAPNSTYYRAVAHIIRYTYANKRKGTLIDSTVENNTVDLTGFLKSLEIAPVYAVGHSYGGDALPNSEVARIVNSAHLAPRREPIRIQRASFSANTAEKSSIVVYHHLVRERSTPLYHGAPRACLNSTHGCNSWIMTSNSKLGRPPWTN